MFSGVVKGCERSAIGRLIFVPGNPYDVVHSDTSFLLWKNGDLLKISIITFLLIFNGPEGTFLPRGVQESGAMGKMCGKTYTEYAGNMRGF